MLNRDNRKQPADYLYLTVTEEKPLLEFLLANVKNESRTKIKATLRGRGIKVDGKFVTQFDFPLQPGIARLMLRLCLMIIFIKAASVVPPMWYIGLTATQVA